MFCRSLFVLLSFFFWPLYCLFFDLRILITPLWYFQTLLITNTTKQGTSNRYTCTFRPVRFPIYSHKLKDEFLNLFTICNFLFFTIYADAQFDLIIFNELFPLLDFEFSSICVRLLIIHFK